MARAAPEDAHACRRPAPPTRRRGGAWTTKTLRVAPKESKAYVAHVISAGARRRRRALDEPPKCAQKQR